VKLPVEFRLSRVSTKTGRFETRPDFDLF